MPSRARRHKVLKPGYNSIEERKDCIEELLVTSITATSSEFSGPDGRSLGVEVAINAYCQGELSTGRFHKSILKLAVATKLQKETCVFQIAMHLGQSISELPPSLF